MTHPPRIPAEAGFVSESSLPRGPNGRALCRQCGSEVPRPRMTFCGPACVHEWKLRTQPSYQARHVLERDKGLCAGCGRDCLALLEDLKRRRLEQRRERHPQVDAWQLEYQPRIGSEYEVGAYADYCESIGLPAHLRDLSRRLWEMDHVVPVAEGGGSCGLDNLQTLCWACHGRETAKLAARRAKRRRRRAC